MRKFPLIILITFIVCTSVALFFSCDREEDKQVVEEIQTARPTQPKNCSFTVCDTSQTPDLHIRTAADQDANTYFQSQYGIRAIPIEYTPNFLVTGSLATYYGWDSLVRVNMVRIQCLNENIADVGCKNDWAFDTSQGKLVGVKYQFEGLFLFDTYEKGNGNNWRLVYTDYKKDYNPSVIPAAGYDTLITCYYDRGIPAKTGDFYRNYFRFPNHDGIYRLTIRFNPSIKGCRAVKETNYNNNDRAIELEIRNGQVIIK